MTEQDLADRKDALLALLRQNEDKPRAYIRDLRDATIQRERGLQAVHDDYCARRVTFDQRAERVETIWATFDAEKARLEGVLKS